MKLKALLEAILAGFVVAAFSYHVLITQSTYAALAISHKMPEAWFSSLLTWYAAFVVIGVSLIIGGVACWMVYRYAAKGGAETRGKAN